LESNFIRSIHDISKSQFKSKFYDDYKEMKGSLGIGVISDRDPQPLIIGRSLETLRSLVAGLIENANELASELLKEGETFGEMSSGGINSVELIAKLITKGRTIPEGIEGMYDRIKGSASILLLKKNGIFAARDRLGRTPLVIGEKDGEFAIATETCSFLNLGFRIKKYLDPGEIVFVGKSGLEEKLPPEEDQSNLCFPLDLYRLPRFELRRDQCRVGQRTVRKGSREER
jgi:amidophosphoribosyltransferase